jgi:hypothetical protein
MTKPTARLNAPLEETFRFDVGPGFDVGHLADVPPDERPEPLETAKGAAAQTFTFDVGPGFGAGIFASAKE